MTIFNILNVWKLKFQVTTLSCILLLCSQFAIGSVLTSKSFNFPNTLETKTQPTKHSKYIFSGGITISNHKMFSVFNCLHTYETSDPFSPMRSLRMILEPENSFEFQSTVLALVSRNKENYFRFADECHWLLHGARGRDRFSPVNSDFL